MLTKITLLTIKEVAVILGIAEKTVRKYVWEKTIPYCKINGHVRFDQERLFSWIEERQVPTIEEIQYGSSRRSKNRKGA